MATNHVPDHVPSLMERDFGTVVLITDPKSDRYLRASAKKSEEKKSKKV